MGHAGSTGRGRLGRRPAKAVGPLLLLAAACMLSACGYQFQGQATLPGGASRLFVDMFENRSGELGLETTVTNAVVLEFTRRGKSLIVGDSSAADLLMKGVIRSVESRTISSRNRDAAGERRVTMVLDIRLLRPDGKIAWAANGLAHDETYSVADDKFLNEEKQRVVLGVVATRIAERIYNRFSDNF